MEKASAGTNYPVFQLGGRERREGNVERCGKCCMVMAMIGTALFTMTIIDPYYLVAGTPGRQISVYSSWGLNGFTGK